MEKVRSEYESIPSPKQGINTKSESKDEFLSEAERHKYVTENLHKGVDALTHAVRYDQEENFEDAIHFYEKGLFYLGLCLKAEKDIKKSMIIMSKIQENNNRVEELKEGFLKSMKLGYMKEALNQQYARDSTGSNNNNNNNNGYTDFAKIEDRLAMLSRQEKQQSSEKKLELPLSPEQQRQSLGIQQHPQLYMSASQPSIQRAQSSVNQQQVLPPQQQQQQQQVRQNLPYGHPGQIASSNHIYQGMSSATLPQKPHQLQSSMSTSSISIPPPSFASVSEINSASSSNLISPSAVSASSSTVEFYSQSTEAPKSVSSEIVMGLVQDAASLINEARNFEKIGQTDGALERYHLGISQIMKAIQLEEDPALKQVLRLKTHCLLASAEDLKAAALSTERVMNATSGQNGLNPTFTNTTLKSIETVELLARKAREFSNKSNLANAAEYYQFALTEIRAALEREDAMEVKKFLYERMFIIEASLKGVMLLIKVCKTAVPYPYSLIFSIGGNLIKQTSLDKKFLSQFEEFVAPPQKVGMIDNIFSDSPSSSSTTPKDGKKDSKKDSKKSKDSKKDKKSKDKKKK